MYGNSRAAQIDGVPNLPGMSPIDQSVTTLNYCCIEGLTNDIGGTGNIADDPLFAYPQANDYHLKSKGWRWNVSQHTWTHDDVTSPCIDAGNPGSPLFDEPEKIEDDISNHWGKNIRINMGVYGGTSEASMSQPNFRILSDINNDNKVDIKDYTILTSFYAQHSVLSNPQISVHNTPQEYDYGDLNHDKQTNASDISILSAQWLLTVNP